MSKRVDILKKGIELTEGDRNKSYGSPHPNLTTFAHLVNSYLKGHGWQGPKLNSVDGSVIMCLAKISRIAVNQHHDDNYIDLATYGAIAGECAAMLKAEDLSVNLPCDGVINTSPGGITVFPEGIFRSEEEMKALEAARTEVVQWKANKVYEIVPAVITVEEALKVYDHAKFYDMAFDKAARELGLIPDDSKTKPEIKCKHCNSEYIVKYPDTYNQYRCSICNKDSYLLEPSI